MTMKLSKPVKVLIGLATAWFALYPLLFFVVWLAMAVGMFAAPLWLSSEGNFPVPMLLFFAIFPLHVFTIFLQFVLIPFYLIHVIKNSTAAETVRIVLGVGIFFLPFLAMPVYYYVYIWLDRQPAWALAATAVKVDSVADSAGSESV